MFTDFELLMNRCTDYSLTGLQNAVCSENLLGRGSESSRAKLYKELKGRYLLDQSHPLFSLFLEEWKSAASHHGQEFCAYVLFALNDKLVFSLGCDWLFQYLVSAPSAIRVGDLENFLMVLSKKNHPEIAAWSVETRKRVVQHYLASVRDFGLATGAINKATVRPALLPAPARFLLRALSLAGISQEKQIRHEAFKLLGIAPQGVIDALSTLNSQGVIRFRMQADVIELKV